MLNFKCFPIFFNRGGRYKASVVHILRPRRISAKHLNLPQKKPHLTGWLDMERRVTDRDLTPPSAPHSTSLAQVTIRMPGIKFRTLALTKSLLAAVLF